MSKTRIQQGFIGIQKKLTLLKLYVCIITYNRACIKQPTSHSILCYVDDKNTTRIYWNSEKAYFIETICVHHHFQSHLSIPDMLCLIPAV